MQRTVEALPTVLATSDPAGALAAGTDAAVAGGAVSGDGRVALMTIQYPVLEQLDKGDLAELKDAVAASSDGSLLRIELGGDLFMNFEDPGGGSAELIGLLAAMVILLLAFGSIIAAGLPIGIALFGLGVGIASMSLIDYIVEIPSWAPDMATMIGLGVGIDYALFLITRHREFLADGLTVADAAGCAVATAGQAVIFAGGTVVIAILGLAVAGVPFMTAAGIATSIIVAMMVAASITLLPAVPRAERPLDQSPGYPSAPRHRRRGRLGLAAMGSPRDQPRLAIRRRCDGAAPRLERAGSGASPGLPRRGNAARLAHGTGGLRPRRRRVRPRDQRPARHCGRSRCEPGR